LFNGGALAFVLYVCVLCSERGKLFQMQQVGWEDLGDISNLCVSGLLSLTSCLNGQYGCEPDDYSQAIQVLSKALTISFQNLESQLSV